MAKKKNIFSQNSLEKLKYKTDSTIEYLNTVVAEELTDELDFAVTERGIQPKLVSTIERKLETALATIKECCSMLVVVTDQEGVSPYIERRMKNLKDKLEEFMDFFDKRPVASLTHRRLFHEVNGRPTKKNPTPGKKTITVLVATKEQQILAQQKMNKTILETLPILDKLTDLTESVEVKGGFDVPDSLIAWGLA